MIVRPRLLLAWASLTQPRSRSTQMHTLRSPHQPSQIDSACRQLSLTYPQGLPLVTRRRRGHTGESLKARATPSAKGLGRGELVAGIDLGTTNSCIAVTRGDRVRIVPVIEESSTLPSVVSFLDSGECLVGPAAKRRVRKDPLNTFYSVKSFIGRALADVGQGAERVAYRITSDEEGHVVLACKHSKQGVYYPEEVSAQVLLQLLRNAEDFAGAAIKRAVISVPAYFNTLQQNATIAAGRLAGLEQVKLIKEPVAAALAYGVNAQDDQTIMVLDLGGGTFDVSILEVGGGVVEVLSTGGDPRLGGDDWDMVIVEWLASTYLSTSGLSWRDPAILGNLRAIAELAKVKLSTEKQVALKLPINGPDSEPTVAKLTQQELDRLSEPLYRRLRLPVDACCWQAGVDLEEVLKEHEANQRRPAAGRLQSGVLIRPKQRPPVSKVLLVGGATRMPTFQRFVRNMTGMTPDPSLVDPDLAVAIGAAVHAGSLGEGSGSLSQLETMDPFKKALMQAIATKQMREDEQLGRNMLGDEYEEFMRQQQKEDDEWSKADMDGADQEGDSSPVEGAAHSEAAESQDS